MKYAMQMLGLIAMSAVLSGCFNSHGPVIPKDWVGSRTTLEGLEPKPQEGRLQIITAYSPPLFSHAALRLVCPDRPVVFWDPGGDYAKDAGPGARSNDLIANPPTMQQYLAFREQVHDQGGEIFEWDLTAEEAQRYYDVLTSGNPRGAEEGKFGTDRIGLQCALSISDFLKRFSSDDIVIEETYFYPYSLAQCLWKQNADRVLVYRRNLPLMLYYPRERVAHGESNP